MLKFISYKFVFLDPEVFLMKYFVWLSWMFLLIASFSSGFAELEPKVPTPTRPSTESGDWKIDCLLAIFGENKLIVVSKFYDQ